jgi:hypothetical protein
VAVLLLACGLLAGACSTSTNSADKFVGTWTFDSGTVTPTNCQGLGPVSLVGETLTLAKGTGSDLMSTFQSSFGTCALNLTVSGNAADADAGQTCMFNVPVAGTTLTFTFNVTSWTVTTTNGMAMTTNATAAGTGLAAGCSIALTGSATKHADADASAG